MQASYIKQLHCSTCPQQNQGATRDNEAGGQAVVPAGRQVMELQLSCDGVSESRSSSISLDVYSVRIKGCKQVYPLRIFRQLDKSYKDFEDHLEQVVNDLIENLLKIESFIADNLKRANARRCLNHASLFPCEYCFSRGCHHYSKPKNSAIWQKKLDMKRSIIQARLNLLLNTPGSSRNEIQTLKTLKKELNDEENNGTRKKTTIVWLASTRGGEPRTDRKMQDIIQQIQENPNLEKNEKKGVVGRSPLWDIPQFNFVRDIVAEYMHAVCIGVVKRLLELTFSIGETRTRVTKRKLSSPSDFDALMADTKVVRECSRRARKLDFAVMKAQELRNIILFFFVHVLQCIEQNAKERRLWLLLAYIIRACVLPSNEFKYVNLNDIEEASKEFYSLYERLFGPSNCTYNTHIVGSHVIEMRAHGPLTLTSAFGFESFYGEMRQAFTPGTQSPLKQIMEKILIKRALSFHCCNNSIYFSDHDSPLECNTIIYCYENDEHQIYQIIKVQDDNLLCYKQGKYNFSFKETSDLNLNWSQVGVYKKGGLMQTINVIPKNKVSGKVLHVGEFLITCPLNVLREK